MSEHITWQEIAVGAGLFGIAAYLLWPAPPNPVQQAADAIVDPAAPALQDVGQPAALPSWLTINRPSWAVQPPAGSDLAAVWGTDQGAGAQGGVYPSVPLPDGLVMNTNQTFSGGNYLGGNTYVGDGVPLMNPAVAAGYQPVQGTGNDCGCGCD